MGEAEQVAVGPGDVLAGKYEIVRVIGRGGMAVVFEGIHQRLGKKVAIKVLHGEATKEPEIVRRFEREAMAAAQLESPHVARVADVESLPDGSACMVMEYLEGHDLEAELWERGQLEIEEAVQHVLQACFAMIEAHELGIVHRDLKPQNLFLAREGDKTRIKVLDFGISKFQQRGDKTVTQTTSSFGTPQYMSPEQIRSTKYVDGRADIWSLGVILYELLAGKPPFSGRTPTAVVAAISADQQTSLRELRPDVPAELSDVVDQALAKEPADRCADVATFAQALAPFGPASAREALARMDVAVIPSAEVSSAEPRASIPELVDAPTEPAWTDTQGSWARGKTTRFERAKPWLLGGAAVLVAAAVLLFAFGGEDGAESDGEVSTGATAAELIGESTNIDRETGAGASEVAASSSEPVPTASDTGDDPAAARPSATSATGPQPLRPRKPPTGPPPRRAPTASPRSKPPPTAGDHPLHL